MDRKQLLNIVEESLELDADELTGEESLADMEEWDSMAVISLIALVDETFEITLEPEQIMESETVNDIIKLIDTDMN